jgi:penicillin-binding protein 1C
MLYLPVPELQSFRREAAGTVIADRNGNVLTCLPDSEGAFLWKLSWPEIPEEAREVFLHVEDRRFYRHRGVDPLAAARAALLNLTRGRTVSGASTVTMQLARLIRPHDGGPRGKLSEALAALRLEARLGKREILRLYLNHVPFGYNTRGLGAAAVRYFDRPLAELSRAQLLILATIPRAPARYDPFRAPEVLVERAAALAPGLGVSREELSQAIGTCRRGEPPRAAPHFVRRIREDLARLPAGRRGPEVVRVITTLDARLNQELQRIVREQLARTGIAARQAGSADGGLPAPVADAGVLVLDTDGEVLAWVGAPDESTAIDAVEVRLSSGSTLKPFLYSLALEQGYTAASLLPDLPLSFGVMESYRPENFDRKRRAAVRLRTALASSLNTPAVYLLSRVGLDEFLALCERLGFEFPAEAAAHYGLGAAMGNAEATLAELTRAFSVFPNRGLLQPARRVRALVMANGGLAPFPGAAAVRVFNEETAWLVGDILSDPAARSTGFGVSSRFNTLPRAMFKSGTSSDYESLWCLGATGSHTVGVWTGNLDGRPAFGTTGSSLPATIALAAFEALSEYAGPRGLFEAWPRPPALGEVRICTASGRPASPACPATRLEYLPVEGPGAGSAAAQPCPLHGLGAENGDNPAELLLAGLLGEQDGTPRILFPLPEQLFYLDRAASLQVQRLESWIAAPPRESLTLRIFGSDASDGQVETRLAYPFRAALPLEPGTYRLEVVGAAGVDSVRYHVR